MHNLKVYQRHILQASALTLAAAIFWSCTSKEPATKSFPLGAISGHGRVLAINPVLELMTIDMNDRHVPLWVPRGTQYFRGKDKITLKDIQPGNTIDFEGWSYGNDIKVRTVRLR